MTFRPLLLDLFCGAGGCAVGYHRAGFDVLGVDHRPQPRYPFSFVQDDAMKVLERLSRKRTWRGYRARNFAVIHASPPCQRYSKATFCRGQRDKHPDLIAPVLELLYAAERLFVIENVERAPLSPFAIMLCGLSFGLKVFRHRLFESSILLFAPEHVPHGERRIGKDGMVCVCGNGGSLGAKYRRPVTLEYRRKAAWSRAMGIDWMTRYELAQAIPPAYTEYIGRQLRFALENQQ